jgi:hypothetical protein
VSPSRGRLWGWTAGLTAAAGLAIAVPEAAAAPPWCHVVQRGESLAQIARRVETSVGRLRQMNAIGGEAPVRPGHILALPAIERLSKAGLASMAIPIPASRGHRERENARADADRLSRIRSRKVLDRFGRLRLLVPVPAATSEFDVVGVPEWRRMARPWTRTFLTQLGAAMSELFDSRLRVTDLTRTEVVQLALQEWNGNAAPARGPLASTHLTGAAVDLSKVEHSDVEIAWLRIVLRRLTAHGVVDAIEEFAQPHFHVMVLRAYTRYATRLRAVEAIGC